MSGSGGGAGATGGGASYRNRNDRSGRIDRHDRNGPHDRHDRNDQRDRNDRQNRNDQSDRNDRPNRNDQSDRHERMDRNIPPTSRNPKGSTPTKPSTPPVHRPIENEDGSTGGLGDKVCVVCYKEVKYFSVGGCDHSVCHECSARMRVIMEQNECPICRQSLDFVVFNRGRRPIKDLKERLRMFIFLPQWGLYLEDEGVQRDFERLLEHRCPFCKEEGIFKDFKELKTHVQRTHDLFACDLCADNIKLFSKERRFYSRADLAHHKRKGDKLDKSHRGHPLCQFCDKRYFDEDELYKHLRKDHYFCHFCDADGFNHYYNTYDDLRIHFRREHFLCEEENCKEEKFTTVFRTEIDMKAHLTAVHSRLLGRHGVKQARVIDVEFNVKSDDERRSRRFNRDGFVGRRGGREGREGYDQEENSSGQQQQTPQQPPVFEPTSQPKVDSVADFPMLEGAGASKVLPVTNGTSNANSSIAQKLALTSGKNVSTSKQGQGQGGGKTRWNAKVTGSSKHDEEFPALGPTDLPSSNSVSQQSSRSFNAAATTMSHPPPVQRQNGQMSRGMSHKVLRAQEEFPSLGNPSHSSGNNGSAWKSSGVKMKGQVPRKLKVASAPLERKIEVDPHDQFHFVPLSVSRARKDSLTKKYDVMSEEFQAAALVEAVNLGDEKSKKKKKNKNDSMSATAKAADVLFNGGKTKGTGGKGGSSSSSNFNDRVNLKGSEEFPSLEKVKKSLPSSSSTPSFSALSEKSNSSSEKQTSNPNVAGIGVSGPPPGFAVRPSRGDSPLDMSFLNSASGGSPTKSQKNGSTYSNINNNNDYATRSAFADSELRKAKKGASGKLYTQPPEFTHRNLRLVEGIKSSLSSDESSFDMFRSVSNQYKKGEIQSKEFYELCQDMFGMTDFRVIFPELLALLPDIDKQQELLSAHRKAGGLMTGLSSCQECFQVIKAGDMASHIKSHSAGDLFPALGK